MCQAAVLRTGGNELITKDSLSFWPLEHTACLHSAYELLWETGLIHNYTIKYINKMVTSVIKERLYASVEVCNSRIWTFLVWRWVSGQKNFTKKDI